MGLYSRYEVVIDTNGVEKRESYDDVHRALMAYEYHKLQPETASVEVCDFDENGKVIAAWER